MVDESHNLLLERQEPEYCVARVCRVVIVSSTALVVGDSNVGLRALMQQGRNYPNVNGCCQVVSAENTMRSG